jgi:hypothetical protein
MRLFIRSDRQQYLLTMLAMKLHMLVAASALLASSALCYVPAAGSLMLRGMPASTSSFAARQSAGAGLRTTQSHGLAVRRSAALATRMKGDNDFMPLLTTAEDLENVISKGSAAGYGVIVLFKKEVCRKCAALTPRFRAVRCFFV